MISKTKLWSIGKLSIATLLLLTTSIRMAKAADPAAAPSGLSAAYPPGDRNSIKISWTDNTVNETKFVISTKKVSNGATQAFYHAAVPGRGTRLTSNLLNLAPGVYKYKVCATQPEEGETCNQADLSFTIFPAPGPVNINFSAPTNVDFIHVAPTVARISWNHPGGASKFNVYITRPGNNQPTLERVTDGNARNTNIISLLSNTKYPVKVCGVSLAGEERCSPAITVFIKQEL